PPCDLADHFLDPAQYAIRRDPRIARTHQVHLHAQVERTLNRVGNPLVELEDPQIEITIETHRVVQQNIGQLTLGQHEIHHALEVFAELVDRVRFVRAQALDTSREFGQHLSQELLEKHLFVLEIKVEGASGDPRAGDNISDISPVIAFAREYSLGVPQHLGSP